MRDGAFGTPDHKTEKDGANELVTKKDQNKGISFYIYQEYSCL